MVRRRNSLEISRTMGGNGKPKGRTRLSMSMITAPSQTGKRFRMGFTMWSTTAASGVLGIDHETAEFALESIRRWWRSIGSGLYSTSKELLIVAGGGGSKGVGNRLGQMRLDRIYTGTSLVTTL